MVAPRVQAANGITPLPIEEATGEMDPKIYDVVKRFATVWHWRIIWIMEF